MAENNLLRYLQSRQSGGLMDGLTPHERYRQSQALMADQWDRPTTEEAPLTQRGSLLPFGRYEGGNAGFSWPGMVTEPVNSMARLLQNGYQPGTGDVRGVEDAFNVAGAAAAGAFAIPKSAGAGGVQAASRLRGYRGSESNLGRYRESGPMWASSDPETAGRYALDDWYNAGPNRWGMQNDMKSPNVTPAEFRFQNPMVVNAEHNSSAGNVMWNGKSYETDELATMAQASNHDGLIIRNVYDDPDGLGLKPQTTIAALQRGTAFSPYTGAKLFANGQPVPGLLTPYYGQDQR